jgi:hypothetical protein
MILAIAATTTSDANSGWLGAILIVFGLAIYAVNQISCSRRR